MSFGGVGDLLMATPAIRALRQSADKPRRITLLATRTGSALARQVEEVDEPIGYDPPWRRAGIGAEALQGLAVRYALRLGAYDGAVVFSAAEDPPAAELCRLAGIPLLLAGAPPATLHPVRGHLQRVAEIGALTEDERLSFHVRAASTSRARLKLEEAALEPRRPIIVVHPGSDHSRWPPERLAALARQLAEVLEAQIAIVGPPSQRALAESIRREVGAAARSLAGSLSLQELAAALELAALVLSNDGNASQLASAVQTPVVDLRGDPRQAPWMVAHRVVESAGVEEAVRAACDLWLDIHWRAAA